MKGKKKVKYREKYKPTVWLYLIIIICFAIVRFLPFSMGTSNLDDAINDLAIGGSASALVALFVDIKDCSKKNRDLHEKQRMIFAEYCGAINDLVYLIVNRCEKFSNVTDELDIKAWLDKLSDKANYPENISPATAMNRAYFHIGAYTRDVKSTLVLLRQQYGLLVESDIVDTDELRQHIALQVRICDDICDALELNENNYSNAAEFVNANVIQLHSNAILFFSEQIPKKYSRQSKG